MEERSQNKSLRNFFAGGMVLKNLPFIYFSGLLALFYIANAHSAEKKVRQIHKLRDEVKELRWQYMSFKSEFLFSSSPTQLANDVKSLDMGYSKNSSNKKLIGKD
ncbi:MAG: FtsL-like putative cell division protein [Saprospiraceae bacterium]